MSKTQHISSSSLRKYRTELPNLYDDVRLSPYEFRLLAHYVRVGNCYQSVRTTAGICCMSVGQVVKARESLEAAGWIKTSTNDEYGTIDIIVVDKWGENFRKYEQGCSPHEQGCSPHEPKNKPIKKKEEEVEGDPQDKQFRQVIRAWEKVRGTINPMEAQLIGELCDDWEIFAAKLPAGHPDQFRPPGPVLVRAIEITAAQADRPNLKYVEAVIKSWKQHGVGNSSGRKKAVGYKIDPEAAELAAAEAKRVAVAKREAARRKQKAK
jgi:hypothetical protein